MIVIAHDIDNDIVHVRPIPTFVPIPPGIGDLMLLRATHGRFKEPDPAAEAVYDKLAKRLYVSKEFAKRLTYMIGYSGKVDPWIKHLVNTEIEIIMNELPAAKIRHRGVFIERQLHGDGVYRYICHTGISKFLPDLYDAQEQAIAAVNAKLDKTEKSP